MTLQAEQAELSGARVSSGNAGYTGTGYADYANASGDYVRWAADVTTAGEYTLEFRYASGGSDRPLELHVNGVVEPAPVVPDHRLLVHPPGSTVSARVTLPARQHLQLTSVGSNGPNLDAVTIRPATTSGPTTVQAESSAMFGARLEHQCRLHRQRLRRLRERQRRLGGVRGRQHRRRHKDADVPLRQRLLDRPSAGTAGERGRGESAAVIWTDRLVDDVAR